MCFFWTRRAGWVEGRDSSSCEGCKGRNYVASAPFCDRERVLYRSIARMWEGLQRGKEGGDVERGKKREVTEGIGMLQASNSSQNQGLSPSLALQDARSPRAEVGHDCSPVPLHPFNSAGYLQPRILQGEVSGRAQEQMVSLVGPICQATLEQLVSAVLSRILFTFASCQQGDPSGNSPAAAGLDFQEWPGTQRCKSVTREPSLRGPGNVAPTGLDLSLAQEQGCSCKGSGCSLGSP